MTDKENKIKQESDNIDQSNKVVDMLLSKNQIQTLDSETMILETQKRVWAALKKDYEYSGLIDESLRIEVLHILKGLTSRESKILKLYFGLDGEKARTLEEVGMEFKLTRERIRQIKEKALQKLRLNSKSHELLQYL